MNNVLSPHYHQEGLICSETDGLYLVYSPRNNVNLLLRKERDGLLGMWIKFSGESINGELTPHTEYEVITAKLITIPTDEYILVRCLVEFPKTLQEQAISKGFSNAISDPHHLTYHDHLGKSAIAIVACSVKYCKASTNEQWKILHIY